MTKLLAIDPALSTTGFIVMDMGLNFHETGKITTLPKYDDITRINCIVNQLMASATRNSVRYVVLEDGFVGNNRKTAIQLATLRGAILGTAQYCGFKLDILLPSVIRKELGIGGDADKEKVAMTLMEMFKDDKVFGNIGPFSDKNNKRKTSDIYDAAAIGVAFVKRKNRQED